MSLLKRLGKETAIYGVSSILGRAMSFLLQLILYSNLFAATDYGVVAVLYPIVAFCLVTLKGGLETAYFRFATSEETLKEKAFFTGMNAQFLSALVFLVVALLFRNQIVDWLEYPPEETIYIVFLACVVFFDVVTEIPFARLRLENKPIVFASIKVGAILLNVLLNIGLLVALPMWQNDLSWSAFWSNPPSWIGYVFIANFFSSLATFLALEWYFVREQISLFRWQLDKDYLRKMLVYSLPLVLIGFAGIINETIDRIMLKKLLPGNTEFVDAEVGAYSMAYKFAMLITLFTQAYRYAAEPFFFGQSKEKNAKETYRNSTAAFATITAFGVILILLFKDYLVTIIGFSEEYQKALVVVPIILLANWFLGIYYNLSVWYKLTDKTMMGAYVSIVGAVLTIAINWYFIPTHGYMASAWATLAAYGTMTAISYSLGQVHYRVNYRLEFYLLLLITGFLVYWIDVNYILSDNWLYSIPLRVVLFGGWAILVYQLLRKVLNSHSPEANN